MAKPSRSKQPAFDPAELEDLIFTPAVGSGVGSHLVRTPNAEIDPTTVVTTQVATAVTSAEMDVTAVGRSGGSGWVTETGESVPHSRVRPIRTASDALSAGELMVYEALWNWGSSAPQGDRICQAGYDYLV